jgi:hypothetical protein
MRRGLVITCPSRSSKNTGWTKDQSNRPRIVEIAEGNRKQMLQSLFRAASPDFDVRAFADRHHIVDDDIWLKGEGGIRGPRPESGFSLLVADSEDLSEHLQQLDEFLLDFAEAIQELRQLTIPCRIDCGLTVGGEKHFTRSFVLSPKLMFKLGELGVEFMVSAYPCSE